MGRHADDGTRTAAKFDAQFAHSLRMALARPVPLQTRINEYIQLRREDRAYIRASVIVQDEEE